MKQQERDNFDPNYKNDSMTFYKFGGAEEEVSSATETDLENPSANCVSDAFGVLPLLFGYDCEIGDDRLQITGEFRQKEVVNLDDFFGGRGRNGDPCDKFKFVITLLEECLEAPNENRRRRFLRSDCDLIAHGF